MKKKFRIIGVVFTFSILFFSCNDSPYMQGKRLYAANCQSCHMEDGSGLQKLIPSLQASTLLGKPKMVCVIKNGILDTIRNGDDYLVREMPAFGKLSATEVTNIINYVNHTWNKEFKETTIIEIENAIKHCK